MVALADVRFPEGSEGARLVAGYRAWLGLETAPDAPPSLSHGRARPAGADGDIDLSRPVELVVLAAKERAARCRLLGADGTITLRSSGLWDAVPGEIVTVRPRKRWRYAGHPYLSGDVADGRLDVAALGVAPLRLEPCGTWDPAEEYWGEEGDAIDDWARSIIAHGPRPEFEMEQVLPGSDPNDPDVDPVIESNELKDAGDLAGARRILMALLEADLRCLDAHAHLGNLVFDHTPKEALRHYEVGVRIGELSLAENFAGVLSWGLVDNRPFLRCMKGYGLCLWRLGRRDEAARVFDRMLWMNPGDNQGIRFLLPAVRDGKRWEESAS
ncbi:MAG: cytoplasmic protein [Gaiellales bacterium]